MRCLPFVLARGGLLSQVIRDAHRNARCRGLCGYCGAPIRLRAERPEEPVRCPSCLRRQRLQADGDAPWRLSASSAEALRRTKSWTRHSV